MNNEYVTRHSVCITLNRAFYSVVVQLIEYGRK